MYSDNIPIIILNWKGLGDTIECMNSLQFLKGDNFTIYLVDNGSGEEEQARLKGLYGELPYVKLVFNDVNKGFTRGNYVIVQALLNAPAPPKYIALLNNDTVVDPDWLQELIRCAEARKGDIVSSKMINYYDRRIIDNVGHFMLNTGEILPEGHRQPIDNFDEPFENVGACGGAVLYRSSMLKEIGFFDLYFDTGYEDAELGVRAKLLGYRCLFEPSAIVFHKVSRSINKIRDDKYIQGIQKDIFYTYIKLMPRRFLMLNLPFVVAKYLIWFLFGVATLQFRLIRLHSMTVWKFLRYDLSAARESRRKFKEVFGDRIQSGKGLFYPTQFFFFKDLRRLGFHLFSQK